MMRDSALLSLCVILLNGVLTVGSVYFHIWDNNFTCRPRKSRNGRWQTRRISPVAPRPGSGDASEHAECRARFFVTRVSCIRLTSKAPTNDLRGGWVVRCFALLQLGMYFLLCFLDLLRALSHVLHHAENPSCLHDVAPIYICK